MIDLQYIIDVMFRSEVLLSVYIINWNVMWWGQLFNCNKEPVQVWKLLLRSFCWPLFPIRFGGYIIQAITYEVKA